MYKIITSILIIITLTACNNSDNKATKQDEDTVDTSTQEKSDDLTTESLVENKDSEELNAAQEQVQYLLKSCVNADYTAAASTIMYRGEDANRAGVDHFDSKNKNEVNTIKVTCEVIQNWLGESENYEFVSYKSDTIEDLIQHEVEVLFKNKSLGISRHFFYYRETDKGMLLFNMI